MNAQLETMLDEAVARQAAEVIDSATKLHIWVLKMSRDVDLAAGVDSASAPLYATVCACDEFVEGVRKDLGETLGCEITDDLLLQTLHAAVDQGGIREKTLAGVSEKARQRDRAYNEQIKADPAFVRSRASIDASNASMLGEDLTRQLKRNQMEAERRDNGRPPPKRRRKK
jgi:hypothetical protein